MGKTCLLAIASLSSLALVQPFGFSARPMPKARLSTETIWRQAQGGSGVRMYAEPSGRDGFATIKKSATRSQKVLTSLPPPVTSVLLNSMVPVAAGAGFIVPQLVVGSTPIGIGGGYLASLLGAQGRRKLAPLREQAAKLAIAELLDSADLTEVSPGQVAAVAAQFNVEGEVLEEICIDIYREFMAAMLKNYDLKTNELRELKQLREVLDLSVVALGEALYETVEHVYRTSVMWTKTADLDDPESIERMTVDKCIYLSARLLQELDTDEGYDYVMARCRKLLSLSQKDFEDRCINLALPMYEKALGAVSSRLDTVNADSLVKARLTLGLDMDAKVKDMHSATFVDELKQLLESSSPPALSQADDERLGRLATVLEISDDQRQFLTNDVVVPLFCDAVDEVLDALESSGDVKAAVASLSSRQTDLRMTPGSAADVLGSIVMDMVAQPFEEAMQYVRVENSKGAVARIEEMVEARDAAEAFLDEMVEGRVMTADSRNAMDLKAALKLASYNPKDLKQAYQLYLADSMTQATTGDYDKEAVQIVEEMLDIDEAVCVEVYNDIIGPLLRNKLIDALTSGELTAEKKASNEEMVSSLNIPASVYNEVVKDLYFNKLAAVGGNNKILTATERETLDQMRAFLGIDDDVAYDLHRRVCGNAYVQAVLEAMGAGGTGIINKDYYAGLDKLADRLMLRPDSTEELFVTAIKTKLQPMVTKLISEFERTVLTKDQYAQRTGKDQGEDLNVDGPGTTLGIESGATMMLDIVNLVDFYEGNQLFTRSTDSATNATTYSYRVTAQGMAEDKLLEDLYRQFVIASFQSKGSPAQQERNAVAQIHFAGILGISAEKKKDLTQDIGKVVYSQYVNNLLKSKGRIEPQDMQQLVGIQNMLNMSDEYSFDLLAKLQRSFLGDKVAALFRADELTGAMVKDFRDNAASMGVDVTSDLDIEMQRRNLLFLAEVKSAVESEEVREDNKEVIEEFQEAWGVPNEVALAEFTKLIENTCSTGVKRAQADISSFKEAAAVKELDRLVKFAQFLPEVTVDQELEEAMKAKMVSTYAAAKESFGDEEAEAEAQARIALLKSVLAVE